MRDYWWEHRDELIGRIAELKYKEDIMADFNYIVESINQLNDSNYNKIQNEIEKVKEQYNNCNSNNTRLFTKFKNLFKNK